VTKQIVILLHGVGSQGNDLQPLARLWATTLPDALFVTPNAPQRFDQGPGYQWFSVMGVTEQNRAQRIAAARAEFDRVIAGILSEHAFDPQNDSLVLAGFSQGSIMALDALVTGRYPLAAVVAFSGRLASVAPYTPQPGARVLLVHGKQDAVIPWTESESAAQKIKALGFDVTLSLEEGTPHTITADGANAAAKFIAQTLSAR